MALTNLQFVRKRAVKPLIKVVRQAVANAKQLGLSSPLKISKLLINKGPVYKRWQPISRGQAHGIEKFTSHIVVELESRISNEQQVKTLTKQKIDRTKKQEPVKRAAVKVDKTKEAKKSTSKKTTTKLKKTIKKEVKK